jgi:hypothetical protein
MGDDAAIHAMLIYGGSFVQALAVCWQRADPVNQQRLRLAFHDVWREYADLSQRAARLAERAAADQRGVE